MKVTSLLSPGWSATFSKPFSSRTGRSTVLSLSPTYSCTTALPARSPVLVTVTVAVRVSWSVIFDPLRRRSEQAKVV